MKSFISTVYTLFLLMILSVFAQAEVNVYDSSEPGMIVIEAIDDCNYSHKLLILLENANSHKTTDWFELLVISKEWNKCLTK